MANFNLGKRKNFVEDNMRYIIQILTGLIASQSTISSQCLKDYNPDETYTKGQICLYNNYVWLCKTVTTGAFEENKWEKQSDGFTELSIDDVKAMLRLTPNQIDYLAKLISDSSIVLDHTWSSSKSYTEIQNAIKTAKEFCVTELAKKSTGRFKKANDVSEITDENYFYLIYNNGTSKYDIYALLNNNVEKLTTVDVNLDNYFTKSEIEADYLKKTDADGKYATITAVDGKVDKTNILSAISSNPSNEKVLSEKAIKSELDSKANANEVLKTTNLKKVVDISLTDNDICSGKAIYNAIEEKKDCIGKETVLYSSTISSEGTFTLADNVNNYDFIIINHIHSADNRYRSVVLSKTEISKCTSGGNRFFCVNGLGDDSSFTSGYFNKNKVVINNYNGEKITSITGYKFGEVNVQHVISNPAPDQSYSTSEQLTGGTWIDGKLIYRRVYTGLAIGTSAGSWTRVGVSLPSNLDKIINATAARITSSSYRNDNLISIALISGTLQYYTSSSYTSNVPNTLILEYTKK